MSFSLETVWEVLLEFSKLVITSICLVLAKCLSRTILKTTLVINAPSLKIVFMIRVNIWNVLADLHIQLFIILNKMTTGVAKLEGFFMTNTSLKSNIFLT